jgi:hypothetical protein
MHDFDPILILEPKSQEVIIYDDVDMSEKEPK